MRTIPVAVRPNKVSSRDFAHPPGGDRSFRAFLDALPDVLVARDFRAVVAAIAEAAKRATSVSVKRVRIGKDSKLLDSSISFLKRLRSRTVTSSTVASSSMVCSMPLVLDGVISKV